MIFSYYWFLLACLVFFPTYWLLRKPALRGAWLIVACLAFQLQFAGVAGTLPILGMALLTYFAALSRRKWLCTLGIVLNAASLVFYKYSFFLCDELIGWLYPSLGAQLHTRAVLLHPDLLPLGISFFTFEFVHYLVEVGRGEEPLADPRDFAYFALFFPSIIAGPIKRYRDFIQHMRAGLQTVTPDDIAEGLKRLAWGLFKKLLIADNLTQAIRYYETQSDSFAVWQAWLFLTALSVRIYTDFSGYTDIAIGLGRMMGVRLPENFNAPYRALNLANYWQRWHISLSSWIRDYVYIPLGGGRKGRFRKLANGLTAFALCGLWHGAAWNFVLWGLWHGTGLAIQSTYRSWTGRLGSGLDRLFALAPFAAWTLTMVWVGLSRLLFFYDPPQALRIAAKLLP